jgi:hypothetical protein
MLETNIRIVTPGVAVSISVRRAAVQGPSISHDLLQRLCGILRYRHGHAAVPCQSPSPSLIVATNAPIAPLHEEGEDFVIDLTDAGEPTRTLRLNDLDGVRLLPVLLERALLAKLARHTDLWSLDSPSIWYEADPFVCRDGIAAYRRFEISSLIVEDAGVGIAADVGTAFFTSDTLAFYFDTSLPGSERERRQELFTRLTGRQQGQKRTLLYDNGRTRVKCYFDDAPKGVTCGTTGKLRVKGKTYDSLYEFYRTEIPDLPMSADTTAILVSFRGLGRPQWVAADRVRVRVMNENTPESLKNVDKISPQDRRALLRNFWQRIEPRPLGRVAEGFADGFWRPDPKRVLRLDPVALEFGDHAILAAPSSCSIDAYKEYFRRRVKLLDDKGCYSIPPAAARTIYCAYRRAIGEEVARRIAGDIAGRIIRWAKRPFAASLIPYDTTGQAMEQLRREPQPGTVLFILDEEPAAYYDVSFQLGGWRVKRITEAVLNEHYSLLTDGAWGKKFRAVTHERGRQRWDQFVTFNALDVFQQMDGIPWRIAQAGAYEAILVIDVGHDRRHFALSVLIARPNDRRPSFGICSEVQVKPDHDRERINPVMLCDQIIAIIRKALRRSFQPLGSMLILRDGRLCGDEPEGVDSGLAGLVDQGMLAKGARVDVVDFHKESQKGIRFWEVDGNGRVENPLEGEGVYLNKKMAAVAATGVATLHQGTAKPFILEANGRCDAILDPARATFAAAQLNWSSPGVAQRFPLPFKRTDDELKARAAQEIRRIR